MDKQREAPLVDTMADEDVLNNLQDLDLNNISKTSPFTCEKIVKMWAGTSSEFIKMLGIPYHNRVIPKINYISIRSYPLLNLQQT